MDIPLDDVGRWQARTAAARLLTRHEPTAIVVSDLSRAHETASFLARAAGLDLAVDARLRERAFGLWEGLTGDDLRRDWADEFAVWRAGGQPEGVGAETRAEVAERVREGILEHAAALGPDDTLVVVSHGSAISCAVGDLLGMPTGLARLRRHAQRPLDRARRHPRRLRAVVADGRLQPRPHRRVVRLERRTGHHARLRRRRRDPGPRLAFGPAFDLDSPSAYGRTWFPLGGTAGLWRSW